MLKPLARIWEESRNAPVKPSSLVARLERIETLSRRQLLDACIVAGLCAGSCFAVGSRFLQLADLAWLCFLLGAVGMGLLCHLLQAEIFRRSYRLAELLLSRSGLALQIADDSHLASVFDQLQEYPSRLGNLAARPRSLEDQLLSTAALMPVLARQSGGSLESVLAYLPLAQRRLGFMRSPFLRNAALLIPFLLVPLLLTFLPMTLPMFLGALILCLVCFSNLYWHVQTCAYASGICRHFLAQLSASE